MIEGAITVQAHTHDPAEFDINVFDCLRDAAGPDPDPSAVYPE